MNYKTTSQLLEAMDTFIDKSKISISTDNKDWKNRDYKSDFVMIDDKSNVGFEVFDNEIIVYYFTGHYHFNDYNLENEYDNNYIKRAEIFLLDLFKKQIKHEQTYKGNSLTSEKYYIIYQDEREDNCIDNAYYTFTNIINCFRKKEITSTIWQYNKSKGCFTNVPPKTPDNDAIEVIDISEDWYIEIFKKNNVYTYIIMEKDFDEYDGRYHYYWTPSVKTAPSGFYDTKEKAVQAAIESLNYRGCE